MVNIITYEPSDKSKYIKYNDIFFRRDVDRSSFDDTDEYLIQAIDSGKLENREAGLVRCTNGALITSELLSDGLKTLLNIHYMMKNLDEYEGYTVNITQCGENAISIILKAKVDIPFDLVLMHTSTMLIPQDIDIKINGIPHKSGDLAEATADARRNGWKQC